MSTRGWSDAKRRQLLLVQELRHWRLTLERQHGELVRAYIVAGQARDPAERRRTQADVNLQLKPLAGELRLTLASYHAANRTLKMMS